MITSPHDTTYIVRSSDGHKAHQEVAAALQLATGFSCPDDTRDWPDGMVNAWNAMVESGGLVGKTTIGEMAIAFLDHQRQYLAEGLAA